jgi:LmbE family N-acetylglucosaminyl deacetylase/glycosyltransferase involved in cell wall biosynthesis
MERAPLPEALARPPSGRVLVFAPHADDEVFGCGGTLALHVAQQDPVRVVIAFDGGSNGVERTRRVEAMRGAARLGLVDYVFWSEPSGHEASVAELERGAELVAEEIAAFRPSTVYAPWVGEQHVDHHALGSAVELALGRALSAIPVEAWAYEVWTPLVPDRVVDISSVGRAAQPRSRRTRVSSPTRLSCAPRWGSLRSALSTSRRERGTARRSVGSAPLHAHAPPPEQSRPRPEQGVKIALLAPFAPDEHAGGTERVAWAQARALRERGHRVRLVVGTERPGRAGESACELVGGIELVRIARLAAEDRGLDLVRPRVQDLVRRAVGDADIAHVHHWHTLAEGLVRVLAPDMVVVLSLHDHFASCPRFFRAAPLGGPRCPSHQDFATCARCVAMDLPHVAELALVETLRERADRSADELDAASAILVPSCAHLERLRATLPLVGRDVRVLEPGMCLEFPSDRSLPPRWDGEGELCVLHFGRRSPEKGTLDLVRSLARLDAGRRRLIAPGGSVSADFDRALEGAAGELALELSGPYDAVRLAGLASRAHLAAFPSRLAESYHWWPTKRSRSACPSGRAPAPRSSAFRAEACAACLAPTRPRGPRRSESSSRVRTRSPSITRSLAHEALERSRPSSKRCTRRSSVRPALLACVPSRGG